MPYTFEPRKDRRPIKENDLVSEQPGFFILFLGLFFSLIVGLSVRTAAQSNWFHSRLREAIANVGSEWRIQHGEVGLYFKDGIKPTIGLYADDVKIASESSCYMKSGGFAQRVRIPLSLIKFIIDGQLVSEIEIQDFKIEITERSPVCHNVNVVTEEAQKTDTKKKNQITIVDRVERNALRNELERVKINKLEIYYPDEKFSYFMMKDIVIENRSVHPKILFLEGEVDLAAFVKTNDGLQSANLKIEYNEFPEKIIKSNLLGSLREGFFSLQLVNRIDDKKFQLQAELKNVSLSLLKNIAPDLPKDVNLKSNWLSTKVYVEGLVDSMPTSTVEIKDVVVNGDLGEFSIDDMVFPAGIKNKPSPFIVNLRGVELSKMLRLAPQSELPDQLESLGVFNGSIAVSDNQQKLEGKISDLGLVFSSKGVRKIEKIEIGSIKGEMKKTHLSMETQDIQNEGGKIQGSIKLKSEDLKSFNLDASLKDMRLSSDVAELITGTDSTFVIDELTLKASGGKKMSSYKASGKIKTLSHELFKAENLIFLVNGNSDLNQEVEIKAERFENSEKFQSILANNSLNLPVVVTKPRLKLARHGNETQLKIDAQTPIRVSAVLNRDGSLVGSLSVKDQEWNVNGTRNNFRFDKK